MVRGSEPATGAVGAFVAVDEFERIGTFLEVQDWEQYTQMLTSGVGDRIVRDHGAPDHRGRRLVYYEVEERHLRGDDVTVINSMTVFAFDDEGKICHLDVYLQGAR